MLLWVLVVVGPSRAKVYIVLIKWILKIEIPKKNSKISLNCFREVLKGLLNTKPPKDEECAREKQNS